MHEEEDLLRGVFRSYAASARRQFAVHVSEEELEQFTSGNLPEERLEAVRDHLAVCHLCLADTLDRRVFPLVGPPDEVPQLSEEQIEERWRKMRSALVSQALPKPKPPSGPPVQRSRRRPIRMAAAVAAVALLAIASFRIFSGFWPSVGAPSVNAQIVSLVPEGSGRGTVTRGKEETVQSVSISAAADSILLVLNIATLSDFSTYRIDLIEAGQEKPRWSDSSIRPTQGMSFTVSFPRAALPENIYLVQLWGGEDSQLQLIAQYQFRVTYEN